MVALQSVARRHHEQKMVSCLHRSAMMLQSQWRCFIACITYRLFIGDVITVQSVFRRFYVIQVKKKEVIAASKIQSFARRMAVRSSLSIYHAQASIIQAAFRGFVKRICYGLDVLDIISIQSLGRRWLAKQMLAKQEYAVLKIQSIVRQRASKNVTALRRRQMEIQELQNDMACKIQSIYRGYRARGDSESLYMAAVGIQSVYRGYMRSIMFMQLRMDVILVQSLARRMIAVQKVTRMISSVIVIQSYSRQLVAKRQAQYLRRMQSIHYRQQYGALQIQSIWRGHEARKNAAEHAAARKIQKTWRCFVTHIDFLVQVMSVLSMQAHVRKFLAMKSYNKTYGSVIKIQAFARGCIGRKQVRKMEEATTKIQAAYRSYLDRSTFGIQRWAAIEIQRMTRGFCARLNFEIEHFAAAEIQRIWRGYDQYVEFGYMLLAALKIQSHVRRHLAKKIFNRKKVYAWAELSFRNQKAYIIQRQFRGYVNRERHFRAARTIQVAFREYLARWRVNMLTRATIRLQAAFRARVTRGRRSKAITHIAHRVYDANKRALEDPTQSLGCRTSSALAVLQSSTSLAEIMDAVKTLESATRFSVACCEVFTNTNAAKILLNLIRACNRSLPHVELVHWILLTLENVGQHSSFLPGFADCKSAEVFLDKVQMFRDKDGIFCLSVSLLQRIILLDQEVKNFCGMHEHLKRLKGIYQLSLRRARPAAATTRKRTGRTQKYERLEIFNRSEALKVLGELIEFVGVTVDNPSLPSKHFF